MLSSKAAKTGCAKINLVLFNSLKARDLFVLAPSLTVHLIFAHAAGFRNEFSSSFHFGRK